MARITDDTKVERLKQSTMKYVVEKGYGGASAALIAKDAKVAVGYFYLHYKGKYEMVNHLLHAVYIEVIEKLNELIDNGSSFPNIIKSLIGYLITMANDEPIKIKFLYVLTSDYSFHIDEEVKSMIFRSIKKIKAIGNESGDLDKKINEDDLYLILVINTIQFINQRFKKFSATECLSPSDEKHLLYIINKTLK